MCEQIGNVKKQIQSDIFCIFGNLSGPVWACSIAALCLRRHLGFWTKNWPVAQGSPAPVNSILLSRPRPSKKDHCLRNGHHAELKKTETIKSWWNRLLRSQISYSQFLQPAESPPAGRLKELSFQSIFYTVWRRSRRSGSDWLLLIKPLLFWAN